jgi:CPA1 family monovalent cation:H+ antiporter
MLPAVMRALGLAHAGRRERHVDRAEELAARRQAIEAAIESLEKLKAERRFSQDIVQPILTRLRDRIKYVGNRSEQGDGNKKLVALHDEIERFIITAERDRINDLYRRGKLKDEARRRIERDLDLRDAHVTNLQAEE